MFSPAPAFTWETPLAKPVGKKIPLSLLGEQPHQLSASIYSLPTKITLGSQKQATLRDKSRGESMRRLGNTIQRKVTGNMA